MKNLTKRLIDITYQEKLSHLSSTLSSLPIIKEIYDNKKDDEVFILSNGHAGLAYYVILEHFYGINAVDLYKKQGIHPTRDLDKKIHCSTGSLGCGLPIAVGHALANKDKNVYCLISDGECAEGSIWESLRFIYEYNIENIKIYVNINGQSAYDYLDAGYLIDRLKSFHPKINIRISRPINWDFAKDILAHYYVLKKEDYEKLCENYSEN